MSDKAYQPREYKSFAYAKRVGKQECMRRGIKAYSVYRLWSNILVVGVDEHAKFLAYVKEHEIPIGRNDEYRVYVWQAGKTDWSRLTQRAADLPCTCPKFENGTKVFPMRECDGCRKPASR